MFPKIGVPQNGWFIMETLSKWMIWGYHFTIFDFSIQHVFFTSMFVVGKQLTSHELA